MTNRRAPQPAAKPEQRIGTRLWQASTALAGAGLVLATAAATVWGGYRLAVSSPSFAIRKVEVETSRRLSDEEVARQAGVELGQNILAFDLGSAEQRLLADPWIQSVRVTRRLPDTLRIELAEHEARALTSIGGDMFLVNADAEPFKRWEAGDVHDLALLTGVTPEDLAKDRSGATARLATGLSVLGHYERLPVSRVHRAQEVHLAPDGSVVLSVGARGVALHLGHGPWPKKLLMVAEVLRRFEREHELPGVVFLDNELHPERVVVRMR